MSNLKMYTITEDEVTEATLKSLESDKNGVIDYPILEFDERALNLLCTGIHETLKCSNVNPVGGYIYKAVKRVTDFLVSLIALLILFIPILIVSVLIYMEDKENPFFHRFVLRKVANHLKCISFALCVLMRNHVFQRFRNKTKVMVWHLKVMIPE